MYVMFNFRLINLISNSKPQVMRSSFKKSWLYIIPAVLLSFYSFGKDRYPDGNPYGATISGSSSCATATSVSATWSNTSCGGGSSEYMSMTIEWYRNTVQSNVGGVKVYEEATTTNTLSSLYHIPNEDLGGTYYYYCNIVWSAGSCAPASNTYSNPSDGVTFTATSSPISSFPHNESLDAENCWTKTIVTDAGTDPALTYVSSSSFPSGFSPTEGSGMIRFNSYSCPSGSEIRLQSPSFSTNGSDQVDITFDWLQSNYSSKLDKMTVQYSVNGGAWQNSTEYMRENATDTWSSKSLTITGVNSADLRIGFLFYSDYGNDCYMDKLTIDCPTPCSGTPAPGTLNASESISCTSLGYTSELSLATPMTESGLSYQWQESAVGAGSWSDISGATSETYTVSLSSSSKDFRLKVTCSNGGAIGYSTTQTITYDCTCNAQTLYWGGSDSGLSGATASTDINDPANWSTSAVSMVPASAINICDDLIFTVTGGVTGYGLSADLTIGSLVVNHTSGYPDISVGTNTLTVLGDVSIIPTGSASFLLGNYASSAAGNVIINGNTNVGTSVTSGTAYLGGTGTTFTFNGDLTFGAYGTINGIPASVVFDGTSAQTFTHNYGSSITLCSGDLTIGSSNPAEVTMAGTGLTRISGNLIVGVGATLDRYDRNLDRSSNGGSLTLGAGSTYRIGGTRTFPTSYTTLNIDVTSTVDYAGSTQTIATAFAYGNLMTSNSGTKSTSGVLTVNGNLTVGASSTFNNGSNGTTLKGNLIVNGTYSTTTAVLTMNGTSAQTISGSSVNLQRVTIDNSSGVTLNNDATISNVLTLTDGHLTLGSNNLTMGTSASAIGGTPSASNMIVAAGTGEFRKEFSSNGGYTFPIGTVAGGNEYSPVTLTFSSGTYGAGAYVGARVNDQKNSIMHDAIDSYINRTWTVEPSGISGYVYDIRLDFAPGDVVENSYTVGSFFPVKYSGGEWYQPDGDATFTNATPQGQHNPLGPASGYLQWDNLTTFSEFGGAGGAGQPLPVELTSFNGACDNGVISLAWETASENNSSHFDVEKSRDGENWTVLSTIEAAGTSNEIISYQAVDHSATDGNNYFRLRQVDIDGTEKLYDPINVSCEPISVGYFSSYPNPSGNAFQIIVNNEDLEGECVLNMVDAQGKVIERRAIEVKPGINMFVMNQNLNPGMYFLNVSNGSKSTPVIRHSIR